MSSVLMTLIVKTLELEKDQILSSKFKTLTYFSLIWNPYFVKEFIKNYFFLTKLDNESDRDVTT